MANESLRNDAMLARYRAGETLESIAQDFGVTRERVRQIVRSLGGPSALESRQVRVQRSRQRKEEAVSRLVDELGQSLPELAGKGIGKADAICMVSALFPDMPDDVVEDAVRRSGVPFDRAVEEFRFSDTLLESSALYLAATHNNWTCTPTDALDWLEPRQVEEVVAVLAAEGVAALSIVDVLTHIAASKRFMDESLGAKNSAGVITKAQYDKARSVALSSLGIGSRKGSAPWPATSQTLMKRMGGGYWNGAMAEVGFGVHGRGRSRGLLFFTKTQYLESLRAFFDERRALGAPERVQDYAHWCALEAAEGRERPSAPAIRLVFGTWQAAKRAAVLGGDPIAFNEDVIANVTHSAVYMSRAQAQISRGLTHLRDTPTGEQLENYEKFIKSIMSVLERNWRLWVRAMVEDSPDLASRVIHSTLIKPKAKEAFQVGGLSAALPDMVIDRMMNFKDGISGAGWLPLMVEESLKSIDPKIMLRMDALREARNIAAHGSNEALQRLRVSSLRLSEEDPVFMAPTSFTAVTFWKWIRAKNFLRVEKLVSAVPEFWAQLVRIETSAVPVGLVE